jgi:hypothetical protein
VPVQVVFPVAGPDAGKMAVERDAGMTFKGQSWFYGIDRYKSL